MTFSKGLSLTLAVALVCTPVTAQAQRSAGDVESARQLYNQGLELRERGDARGALEKFKAAHALGNTPVTGVELCKMHASLKQPLEAREACLSVARIPQSAAETGRSQQARVEAARVAEEERVKIASVRVRLSGVPAGMTSTVTIDGASIPPAAQNEPRALNPGPHEISARVGSAPESKATVELQPGEAKEVTLIVQAPPPESAPPVVISPPPAGTAPPPSGTPAPRKSSSLPIVGFAIAGIGVAVGSVTGLVAMNRKSDLDRKCIDNICGRADHAALDQAETMADVSTTMFVVAGLGAVLGVIGLLSDRGGSTKRATVTPVVGMGRVGVHGSF